MECNNTVDELSAVLEKAKKRTAERELRMRKMKLEMEATMREREDQRRVENMFIMLQNIMLQLVRGRGPGPVNNFPYQPNP